MRAESIVSKKVSQFGVGAGELVGGEVGGGAIDGNDDWAVGTAVGADGSGCAVGPGVIDASVVVVFGGGVVVVVAGLVTAGSVAGCVIIAVVVVGAGICGALVTMTVGVAGGSDVGGLPVTSSLPAGVMLAVPVSAKVLVRVQLHGTMMSPR